MAVCWQVVLQFQSRCSQWRGSCDCGIVAHAFLQSVKGFLQWALFCQNKLSAEAASDTAVFAKYLAVRHHFPLLNICEGPGGLFVKVADVFLQSERRKAVARSRETITKGKVVKFGFRA